MCAGIMLISLALCADAVIGNVQEKALKQSSISEMVYNSTTVGMKKITGLNFCGFKVFMEILLCFLSQKCLYSKKNFHGALENRKILTWQIFSHLRYNYSNLCINPCVCVCVCARMRAPYVSAHTHVCIVCVCTYACCMCVCISTTLSICLCAY